MKEVIVESVDNIIELIKGMELNTYYRMPSNFRYKWIKIEKDEDHYTKETKYCWAMEYNYSVTGTVGYIHPLRNSNWVAFFKTESNAKRNLIKRFEKYNQYTHNIN